MTQIVRFNAQELLRNNRTIKEVVTTVKVLTFESKNGYERFMETHKTNSKSLKVLEFLQWMNLIL